MGEQGGALQIFQLRDVIDENLWIIEWWKNFVFFSPSLSH
jgi:hypothetical protein